MHTELPSRAYVELPPPPDGFATVRREASRRRARRTVATVAGGISAAVVGVVVVLLGGGGDVAVLRPAPVTPATQLPGRLAQSPSPSPSLAAPSGPQHLLPVTGGRSGGATSATSAAGATPTPSPSPQHAGSREPSLVRTQSTYTGATRVCTGSQYGDTSGQQQSGAGWCLDVSAAAVSGGERLSLTLCRDSTSGGSLTFATTREVDLAVMRGGTTVWSWSHDHAGTPSQHTLAASANGCWTWSLVWPDVTQSGSSAGHGTYTLVATSTADELQGHPSRQVAFSY